MHLPRVILEKFPMSIKMPDETDQKIIRDKGNKAEMKEERISDPLRSATYQLDAEYPKMQRSVATAPTLDALPASPRSDMPALRQGGWLPSSMTYPPGLECLITLDYLFLNERTEMLEAFTGWETKKRYTIVDITGATIFYVIEESEICSRLCLGSYRSCEFSILDRDRRKVLCMTRPFRCDSCCCPCYLQVLEVYSGNTLLGTVTREWSLWRPTFFIRDASGKPVLIIKGPIIRFCIDIIFEVKSLDGKYRVGVIRKQWSRFSRRFFSVSDMFGVNFPRDLDVKIKAVLFGACLLIDFLYFEENKGIDLL